MFDASSSSSSTSPSNSSSISNSSAAAMSQSHSTSVDISNSIPDLNLALMKVFTEASVGRSKRAALSSVAQIATDTKIALLTTETMKVMTEENFMTATSALQTEVCAAIKQTQLFTLSSHKNEVAWPTTSTLASYHSLETEDVVSNIMSELQTKVSEAFTKIINTISSIQPTVENLNKHIENLAGVQYKMGNTQVKSSRSQTDHRSNTHDDNDYVTGKADANTTTNTTTATTSDSTAATSSTVHSASFHPSTTPSSINPLNTENPHDVTAVQSLTSCSRNEVPSSVDASGNPQSGTQIDHQAETTEKHTSTDTHTNTRDVARDDADGHDTSLVSDISSKTIAMIDKTTSGRVDSSDFTVASPPTGTAFTSASTPTDAHTVAPVPTDGAAHAAIASSNTEVSTNTDLLDTSAPPSDSFSLVGGAAPSTAISSAVTASPAALSSPVVAIDSSQLASSSSVPPIPIPPMADNDTSNNSSPATAQPVNLTSTDLIQQLYPPSVIQQTRKLIDQCSPINRSEKIDTPFLLFTALANLITPAINLFNDILLETEVSLAVLKGDHKNDDTSHEHQMNTDNSRSSNKEALVKRSQTSTTQDKATTLLTLFYFSLVIIVHKRIHNELDEMLEQIRLRLSIWVEYLEEYGHKPLSADQYQRLLQINPLENTFSILVSSLACSESESGHNQTRLLNTTHMIDFVLKRISSTQLNALFESVGSILVVNNSEVNSPTHPSPSHAHSRSDCVWPAFHILSEIFEKYPYTEIQPTAAVASHPLFRVFSHFHVLPFFVIRTTQQLCDKQMFVHELLQDLQHHLRSTEIAPKVYRCLSRLSYATPSSNNRMEDVDEVGDPPCANTHCTSSTSNLATPSQETGACDVEQKQTVNVADESDNPEETLRSSSRVSTVSSTSNTQDVHLSSNRRKRAFLLSFGDEAHNTPSSTSTLVSSSYSSSGSQSTHGTPSNSSPLSSSSSSTCRSAKMPKTSQPSTSDNVYLASTSSTPVTSSLVTAPSSSSTSDNISTSSTAYRVQTVPSLDMSTIIESAKELEKASEARKVGQANVSSPELTSAIPYSIGRAAYLPQVCSFVHANRRLGKFIFPEPYKKEGESHAQFFRDESKHCRFLIKRVAFTEGAINQPGSSDIDCFVSKKPHTWKTLEGSQKDKLSLITQRLKGFQGDADKLVHELSQIYNQGISLESMKDVAMAADKTDDKALFSPEAHELFDYWLSTPSANRLLNLACTSQYGPSLVAHILNATPNIDKSPLSSSLPSRPFPSLSSPLDAPDERPSGLKPFTCVYPKGGKESCDLSAFDAIASPYYYSKVVGFPFFAHLEQINMRFVNYCYSGAQVWVFIHTSQLDKLKKLVVSQFDSNQSGMFGYASSEVKKLFPYILYGRHLWFDVDDLKKFEVEYLVTIQQAGEMIIADSSWIHYGAAIETGTVSTAINDIPCTWLYDGLTDLADVILPDYTSFFSLLGEMVKDNDARVMSTLQRLFGGASAWVLERVINLMPIKWTCAYFTELLDYLKSPEAELYIADTVIECVVKTINMPGNKEYLDLFGDNGPGSMIYKMREAFDRCRVMAENATSLSRALQASLADNEYLLSIIPWLLIDKEVVDQLKSSPTQELLKYISQSIVTSKGSLFILVMLCVAWEYSIRFVIVDCTTCTESDSSSSSSNSISSSKAAPCNSPPTFWVIDRTTVRAMKKNFYTRLRESHPTHTLIANPLQTLTCGDLFALANDVRLDWSRNAQGLFKRSHNTDAIFMDNDSCMECFFQAVYDVSPPKSPNHVPSTSTALSRTTSTTSTVQRLNCVSFTTLFFNPKAIPVRNPNLPVRHHNSNRYNVSKVGICFVHTPQLDARRPVIWDTAYATCFGYTPKEVSPYYRRLNLVVTELQKSHSQWMQTRKAISTHGSTSRTKPTKKNKAKAAQ